MTDILDRTKIYVDGAWIESTGSGRIDVLNPATEELIGTVAEALSKMSMRPRRQHERLSPLGLHYPAASEPNIFPKPRRLLPNVPMILRRWFRRIWACRSDSRSPCKSECRSRI